MLFERRPIFGQITVQGSFGKYSHEIETEQLKLVQIPRREADTLPFQSR